MSTRPIKEQIISELDHLTPEQQVYLLDIARRLQHSTLPPGTPGDTLIAHMDDFTFAQGALDEMMTAIEDGCERIDWSGWE